MSRPERSSARLALLLSSALFLALSLSAVAAAQDAVPPLPRHVYIAPCLRETVEAMMARSPTFRAQMEALGRARALGVSITLAASPSSKPAEAAIRRYHSGVLLAFISIHRVSDKAELIAHEVEHVLEQVEGVQLAQLVKKGGEAWNTGASFETRRAIRAGRQVATEMMQSDANLTAKLVRPSP